MMTLTELNRKTRIRKCDYTFDGEADMLKLLDVLTPKFEGNWEIALVDPSIKYINGIAEGFALPDYVDCYVYMSSAKIEQVVLKHPSLMPKKQKPMDLYMSLIGDMNHAIDHNAARYLWKALNGDTDKLKEALDKLDNECEDMCITVQQVKKDFTATLKPVFASEVVEKFFTKDFRRWQTFRKFVDLLGESYAYYSIRKQVFKWFEEKAYYLRNKETTIRSIGDIDAFFIDYVYILFHQSVDYRELFTLMYEWDNRNNEALERRTNAYLQ